jgi:RNA polymerase sigma factor (sigma-70 family)
MEVQSGEQKGAGAPLESLCRQYWPPLYAWVRQRGYARHDAQDLTQEFFARLLEKDWLAAADQARGRFRTFLLMALKRFLANEWDRRSARKRGGGAEFIPMDALMLERMEVADASVLPPEVQFDRCWAVTLLEAVMRRLRAEQEQAGRLAEYEVLKAGLTAQGLDYAALGRALGIEPVSARSAVHRLRKRFRELFRTEVSDTVTDPAEVEAEMQAVIAALGAL